MTPTQAAQDVARTIARAKTSRQLRAAIGVTLNELSDAYPLAKRLPTFSSFGPREGARALDAVRLPLEATYRRLADVDQVPAVKLGDDARRQLGKAWNEIAGIRAGVGAFDAWSGWAVLGQAVVEAPRVFLEGAQAVVEGAGKVAGQAGGGLLAGLLKGWWWLLLILAVVAFGSLKLRGRILP